MGRRLRSDMTATKAAQAPVKPPEDRVVEALHRARSRDWYGAGQDFIEPRNTAKRVAEVVKAARAWRAAYAEAIIPGSTVSIPEPDGALMDALDALDEVETSSPAPASPS